MANYPDAKLHIAGDWRQADGQRVADLADASVLGTVPHLTGAGLDGALAAAEQGPGGW